MSTDAVRMSQWPSDQRYVIPVAAFNTSVMTPGSSPKRWPISSASMPIRKPPALTRLFSAFIA